MPDQNPYLDSFVRQTDPTKLRIANYSNVIFFCGGPTSEGHQHKGEPPQSARDFILRKLATHRPQIFERLYFEENMMEWFKDGHFVELQTFEKHASEISSVVFLVAESPGSFVELGAFTSEETIIPKLFVVVSNDNDNGESYLALGPIKFLRESDETKVRSYRWRADFNTGNPPQVNANDLEGIWSQIVDDLIEYERTCNSEVKFNPNIPGHVSLLILELLNIFGALYKNELKQFLSIILGEIELKEIKKHLFLMEQMGLVSSVKHGGTYYISRSSQTHIYFNYLPDTPREIADRASLTMLSRGWYEKNDQNRFDVMRRYVPVDKRNA